MSESKIKQIENELIKALLRAKDEAAAEEVRIRFLGRKSGELTEIMRNLKNLSPEEKREIGPVANKLRDLTEEATATISRGDLGSLREVIRSYGDWRNDQEITIQIDQWVESVAGAVVEKESPRLDLTIPGPQAPVGHKHPLTRTMEDIVEVLTRLGYTVAEGPEVELDHYNFEALNIPRDHPARDMQDTFYVADDVLLRTHTSPVQIRVMEKQKPPVKVIAPGKVFRCDADVTHSPMFHQVEGLYVDKGVTFAHLKGTLETFVRELFGPEFKVRIRPSFFPFTEPSAEVDISSPFLAGGRWLEVLGAGMVDPAVFEAVNQARGNRDYDPEAWTGFAWGLGVERVAMLRYGIGDIRLFYENDLRFLRQF
ncbi:MAG: phenylalanine--tRNA ligase subunit alpha [Candidatus Tectomicrobia bacterium]|uniref:Phenylalanine--tRNA ligase alpha subunit n=1 Tax=Tectimicrobiota bacterium TaxID=2528274 RepID=A0A932HV86_UNCTE|nr:phenylalanine--tRNA ligase subunit alpha [Candidatus Tectomicrobia bacterium]